MKVVVGLFLAVACLAVAISLKLPKTASSQVTSSAPDRFTFSRDVAPIVFIHCAPCHRPGESAPFSLLSYADVKKRAKQIAEVTARRFMPPWLPEPGLVTFANERRLMADQIGIIQGWAAAGAAEGNPSDLPSLPRWSEGWHLGPPDLVLAMPKSYSLQADGKDVYRCFVIPAPLDAPRYVRAAELRPGNPKIVHHAILQIDRTRSSRQLDEQDDEPGFGGGMSAGKAQLPDGHFIGWTPGKVPTRGLEGLAWRLDPGTDLVLQLHMRPSGKKEEIQATVGLYFAAQPPKYHSHALVLRSKSIDIPAGLRSYLIERSCVLPVDVEALSIYPHAHYLGKEMNVSATFPDGAQCILLNIKNWDFNWQDEYRFADAVLLPKGTSISFRYTYDNSSENVRNPDRPPRRVVYGQNSTDEMAELMLQVVPRVAEDLEPLRRQSAYRAVLEEIEVHQKQLETSPNNAAEHRYLGLRYQQIGQVETALTHFQEALRIEPTSSRTHFLLGDALAETGRFDDALRHLHEADRLEPNQSETLNSLAQVLARHPNPNAREPTQAIGLATRAVELTQRTNPMMLETLAVAYAAAGQFDRAVGSSELAIRAATTAQNTELADQIRKRLETYKRSTTRP